MKKLTKLLPWAVAIGGLWQCYNQTLQLKLEREKLWKAGNRIEFQSDWINELRKETK